jgi:hypothetical protein
MKQNRLYSSKTRSWRFESKIHNRIGFFAELITAFIESKNDGDTAGQPSLAQGGMAASVSGMQGIE